MLTHCVCLTRRLCKSDCHYLASKKTSVKIIFEEIVFGAEKCSSLKISFHWINETSLQQFTVHVVMP